VGRRNRVEDAPAVAEVKDDALPVRLDEGIGGELQSAFEVRRASGGFIFERFEGILELLLRDKVVGELLDLVVDRPQLDAIIRGGLINDGGHKTLRPRQSAQGLSSRRIDQENDLSLSPLGRDALGEQLGSE